MDLRVLLFFFSFPWSAFSTIVIKEKGEKENERERGGGGGGRKEKGGNTHRERRETSEL